MVKELGGKSVEVQSPEALREELWHGLFTDELWVKQFEKGTPMTQGDRERELISYFNGQTTKEYLSQFIPKKRQRTFFKKLENYSKLALSLDHAVEQPVGEEVREAAPLEAIEVKPEVNRDAQEARTKLQRTADQIRKKLEALAEARAEHNIPRESAKRVLMQLKDQANKAQEAFDPFRDKNNLTETEKDMNGLRSVFQGMLSDIRKAERAEFDEKRSARKAEQTIVPAEAVTPREDGEIFFTELKKAAGSTLQKIRGLSEAIQAGEEPEKIGEELRFIRGEVRNIQKAIEQEKPNVKDAESLDIIGSAVKEGLQNLLQLRIAKRVEKYGVRPAEYPKRPEVAVEEEKSIELSPEDKLAGDIYGDKKHVRVLRFIVDEHPESRHAEAKMREIHGRLHEYRELAEKLDDGSNTLPEQVYQLDVELENLVDHRNTLLRAQGKMTPLPETPSVPFEDEVTEVIAPVKMQKLERTEAPELPDSALEQITDFEDEKTEKIERVAVPELPDAAIEPLESYEDEVTEIIPRKKSPSKKPRAPKRETIGPEAWAPGAAEKKAAITPGEIPIEPREVRIEPSFVEKAKNGLSYIWSRGKSVMNPITESELYRTQMKGELSSAEVEGKELSKIGKTARITAALLSGLSSFYGVQVLPDAVRRLSQLYYTDHEKAELHDALVAARNERTDPSQRSLQKLLTRIEASRYLNPDQRKEISDKLEKLIAAYDAKVKAADETFNKEAAEILEEAVQAKISRMKVAKEAANFAFAITGYNYLRAGAYAAGSLVERWQTVTREKGNIRAPERIRKMTGDAFVEWWGNLKGNNGDTRTQRFMNRAKALGTLSRGVGMAGVAAESISELLEMYEGALPPTAEHLSKAVDLEAITGTDSLQADPLHPDLQPRAEAKGEGSGEGMVDDDVDELGEGKIPESLETLVSEGIVKKGDGITQRLQQLLFEHPEQFGYKGPDDEVMKKLFATREAIAMARRDGLLKLWLSKEAVGNIALIPIEKADGYHVAFVDVKTDAILDRNAIERFTEKAPSR